MLARRYFFAALLFLGVFGVSIQAGITVQTTIQSNQKAPQGNEVSVMKFTIEATGEAETFDSIKIQNTGDVGYQRSQIRSVKIYLDGNSTIDPNNAFDGDDGDTQVGIADFSDETQNQTATQTVSISAESIPSGNSSRFFIVYDIDSDATLEGQARIAISDITTVDDDVANLTGEETQSSIRISGVRVASATGIAPEFVLPGQEKVALLSLEFRVAEEDMDDNVELTITNREANFDITAGVTSNGVEAVHLYFNQFNEDTFVEANNILVQTITNKDGNTSTDFASASSAVFTDLFPENGAEVFSALSDVSRRYFVVFDIGEEFVITTDTTIEAQMTGFTGTGASSGLPMTGSASLPEPDSPEATFVAGLTFGELESIVPDDDNEVFGQGVVVPMLQFSMFAHHTAVTLNQLSVRNAGTVPYITDAQDTSGVERVQLYLDSDNDAIFDGIDSADNLVGDLQLTGASNQSNRAVITLFRNGSLSAANRGVTIPEFDADNFNGYPNNNKKIFYVVYHMGSGDVPSGANASGNIVSVANARLDDAIGSANVSASVVTMNLQGNLPAQASPEASVTLVDTNLYINDVTDISPTTVVQGQQKVPMLAIELQADLDDNETIEGATMQVLNEVDTFLKNNRGATRVWLYRDEDEDQTLDTTDTFLASFTASANSDADVASLRNLDFTNTTHHLLVLYDIGQVADRGIRAQLNGVSGLGNTNVIFGGEIPLPKEAASVSANAKPFSVTSLTADINADDGLTVTFSAQMIIRNNGSSNLGVTDAFPRFYESTISGKDITTEFSIETIQTFPVTVNAGASLTINYTINQTDDITEGPAVMDAYVEYVPAVDSVAILNRFEGDSNFFSVAPTAVSLTLPENSDVRRFYDLPSHIAAINILSGGNNPVSFNIGTTVPQHSNMQIVFKNSGNTIDSGSISLTYNGVALTRASTSGSLNSGTFSYDESTGVITIADLDEDGSIVLDVDGFDGNALDTATLTFFVSSDVVSLHDALFFPNPFRIGERSLVLGFNITSPAELKIYFFNYQGRKVHDVEINEGDADYPDTAGYHTIEFDAFSSFIKSGMYICKIVATDEDGNESTAVARLAVY